MLSPFNHRNAYQLPLCCLSIWYISSILYSVFSTAYIQWSSDTASRIRMAHLQGMWVRRNTRMAQIVHLYRVIRSFSNKFGLKYRFSTQNSSSEFSCVKYFLYYIEALTHTDIIKSLLQIWYPLPFPATRKLVWNFSGFLAFWLSGFNVRLLYPFAMIQHLFAFLH